MPNGHEDWGNNTIPNDYEDYSNDTVPNDHEDCGNDTIANDKEISAANEKKPENIITFKTYKNTKVSWKKNDYTNSMDNISFYFWMDASINKALITLRTHISLKGTKGKNSRTPFYILIYPENIITITDLGDRQKYKLGSTIYKLQISMKHAPDIVRPKNHTLEPRHKTKKALDLFLDLGKATKISIRFDCFKEIIQLKDLDILLHTFSKPKEDRPSKQDIPAYLKTLYEGEGGEIVTAYEDEAEPVAAGPPSYTDSTLQISSKYP